MPGIVAALKAFACGAAAIAVLVGALGLLGRLFVLPVAASVRSELLMADPAVGVVFTLFGISLWLRRSEQTPLHTRRFADACAFAVVLIGLLALLQYAVYRDYHLDSLLFGRPIGTHARGRMAPIIITPLLFVALGLALIFLDAADRRRRQLAQLLALLVALSGLAGLVGYLYNALAVDRNVPHVPLTRTMSLMFILMSLGMVCARPDRGVMRIVAVDAVGGEVARRLLPAALAGPPLLCILSYLGYVAKWYDAGFGLALLTTLNSGVLTLLIWRTAGTLNQTDAQRRSTEIQRKSLEEQLFQARKLESIGRLAGGVAHDFNNLLTAILGYSELLEMELPADGEMMGYVGNIQKAAERAGGLTGQLLAFARRQVIEPRVVNLNSLILNLETMLQRLIGEHIRLVMQPAADLNSVCVDPNQFEQILINLIVNARDAMPVDGGRITVETGNVTLDTEYARQHEGVTPGEYVMLAVSDTGCGMEEGIRLHIFEPFFTTKEKGRGTGLGLATVYGIVKQTGGHIWLYSEVGVGTTFKIYLPRVIGPAEEITASVASDALPRGSETVLVVEDEVAVRSLTTVALRGLGYRVLEAAKGVEALRIHQAHAADIALLVTDVVMPEMSGKDLAERLQATHPTLKVLFVSGYTENTIVHHGVLESGINFLPKPFTLSALSRKVREVLDAS